jgi:hypothetical protein
MDLRHRNIPRHYFSALSESVGKVVSGRFADSRCVASRASHNAADNTFAVLPQDVPCNETAACTKFRPKRSHGNKPGPCPCSRARAPIANASSSRGGAAPTRRMPARCWDTAGPGRVRAGPPGGGPGTALLPLGNLKAAAGGRAAGPGSSPARARAVPLGPARCGLRSTARCLVRHLRPGGGGSRSPPGNPDCAPAIPVRVAPPAFRVSRARRRRLGRDSTSPSQA